MKLVFWLSIFFVFYAYFAYPLILFIISRFRNLKVERDIQYLPSVTLITAVHNEQKRVERKIVNTLALDYPAGRLEIIFVSDYSTDSTDEIVKKYEAQGIKLVRSPYRGGKEFAQKCAIEKSHGEVLVFTDVATRLEVNGLRAILSNFADSSVGCVSSEDRFVDENGRVSGESAYVKYEMRLRGLESQVNSLVGLSGSFFAARKNICLNWPAEIPSDFNTLLNAIQLGYRGISDSRSVGIYTNLRDEKKEFSRKVRTITRGLSALMTNWFLMNPLKYGLFAWQLASHKLMRWSVPWFLLTTMVTNMWLALRFPAYAVLFIFHLLFYVLAFLGIWWRDNSVVFKIPYYFVQVNSATTLAWGKYFRGERYVTWTPSKR